MVAEAAVTLLEPVQQLVVQDPLRVEGNPRSKASVYRKVVGVEHCLEERRAVFSRQDAKIPCWIPKTCLLEINNAHQRRIRRVAQDIRRIQIAVNQSRFEAPVSLIGQERLE